MQFEGVGAIVTGGGSGLGEATARALAARGAKVTVVDLDAAKAEAVATEIGGLAQACDVASEAAAAAVEAAEARHGATRILVNCAGIAPGGRVVGRGGPMPLETFSRVLQVNLVGTFNMIRLVAARMVKAEPVGGERGVIINTASVAAFEGQVGQAAYSASKGGVVGMTLPLARDLAQHAVRVNTIAPGLFLTPLMKGLPAEVQTSLGNQVPFPPRLGDPAEYGALVVHIAENQMLNGETIRLDGAIRMQPR